MVRSVFYDLRLDALSDNKPCVDVLFDLFFEIHEYRVYGKHLDRSKIADLLVFGTAFFPPVNFKACSIMQCLDAMKVVF